mgnify:CR=1 FL=1
METYVNYAGEKEGFSLPKQWRLVTQTDKPLVSGARNPVAETKQALDSPIGSSRIESISSSGWLQGCYFFWKRASSAFFASLTLLEATPPGTFEPLKTK